MLSSTAMNPMLRAWQIANSLRWAEQDLFETQLHPLRIRLQAFTPGGNLLWPFT